MMTCICFDHPNRETAMLSNSVATGYSHLMRPRYPHLMIPFSSTYSIICWINYPNGQKKNDINLGRFLVFPCYHLGFWEQRILVVRSVLRGPRKAVILSVEATKRKWCISQKVGHNLQQDISTLVYSILKPHIYEFDAHAYIESICLKAFKQIKPNVFDVQRNLLILGVGGRERGVFFMLWAH